MVTVWPVPLRAWAASSWVAFLKLIPLTLKIWSPRLSSPLRSAGPPARMKDTNIPSPSSPPTILKPRPDCPLCNTIVRTSLQIKIKCKHSQIIGNKLRIRCCYQRSKCENHCSTGNLRLDHVGFYSIFFFSSHNVLNLYHFLNVDRGKLICVMCVKLYIKINEEK